MLKQVNRIKISQIHTSALILITALSLVLLLQSLHTFRLFQDKEMVYYEALLESQMVRETSSDLTLLFFYETLIHAGVMDGNAPFVHSLAKEIKDVRDGSKPWPKNYFKFLPSLMKRLEIYRHGDPESLRELIARNTILSGSAKEQLKTALQLSDALYELEQTFKDIDPNDTEAVNDFFRRYFILKADIFEQASIGQQLVGEDLKDNWVDLMTSEIQQIKGFAVLFVLTIVVVYFLQRRHQTRIYSDLNALVDTINQFDGGKELDDFRLNTMIHHDEVHELYQRLFKMMKYNRKLTQETQKMALVDNLTQLNNRHALEKKLAQYKPVSRDGIADILVAIDLDHFKKLNDTYGHQFGDKVLTEVAAVIGETLRERDFFARMGGEEFVILCERFKVNNIEAMTQRLLQAVRSHRFINDGEAVTVTISVGVTDIGLEEEFDDALLRADSLLYQAKNAGRNCVQLQWSDGLLEQLVGNGNGNGKNDSEAT